MGSKHTNRFISKRYIFLFPLIVSSSILSAQTTGDGTANLLYDNMPQPKPKVTGDDIFNDIKTGVIIPQGTFAQPITNPGGINYGFNNLMLPFKGIGGLGAKPGFTLQYEGFTAFGKPHSSPSFTMHFGLQYGLDFGYIPINWGNVQWGNYNMSISTNPFFYTGLKLGPAFYINPTKNLGIGIYAMLAPYITAPGGAEASYNFADAAGNSTIASYVIKDSNSVHFSLNTSAGINIYYKALIIGAEYGWVHTAYNGSVVETAAETKANGSVTTPKENYSFSNVLHTNMLKLTIGVRLGYGCKHRFDGLD